MNDSTARIPALLEPLKVPIGQVAHYRQNPRLGDIDAIAQSLETNGQYRPIVVNKRTGEALAGNQTLTAARQLGWTHIAVTWVDVDEQAARRIVAADNRLSDLGTYDESLLADLLSGIDDGLDGTGFTDDDLGELLAGLGEDPAALTDPDTAPEVAPGEPVSRLGDVWALGPHRLLVGDATDIDAVLAMLAGDRPSCVWTDPPYGVSYVGGTKDALTMRGDDAGGLAALLAGAFATLAKVCAPGAPVYVAHADTERVTFEGAMRGAGLLVRQNLVKSSIVLGRSDYHYRHEPILFGATAGDPGLDTDLDDDLEDLLEHPGDPDDGDVEDPVASFDGYDSEHEPVLYGFAPGGTGRLGRGGDRWHGGNKQSTVFEVPKPPRNDSHPTMKPVELITRMVRNSARPGGLVLDLFGGSGSTLIACHQLGMRAAVVELDPAYADVICRRYQEHTGVVPVRAGRAHDFVPVADPA